ncbi:flavin reductase family protein [Nocardioides sp. AN3]
MSISPSRQTRSLAAERSEGGLSEFDSRQFRDALGHFASGITTITSTKDGEPIGLTCQSFFSVSLEPALVSFSVGVSSSTYPAIREAGRFCVNLLSRDQVHISNQFGSRSDDKWRGIGWQPSNAGNPILDNCLAWVDCELTSEYPAGDHLIVVGQVLEISHAPNREQSPLLFFKGRYHALADAIA